MALFSEQDAFIVPLTDAIARTEDLNAECSRVTEELSNLSFVGIKADIEEKIPLLTEQIVANAAQINDTQDILDEIRASVPEMTEHLRLNLDLLAGEGVHISLTQVPDFS